MLVDEVPEVTAVTIERLSPDDRLLLLSDKVWPQDVGAILILDGSGVLDADGRFPIAWARETMAQRIDALPRLRQVLRVPRRGLGGPFWADAPAFDLSQHVRLGPPVPSGDEAGLLDAVEEIRSRRLDPARPLWEMWFFPGLAGGRVGMFVRLHHVVADGVSGIASLAALLAGPGATGTRAETRWTPADEPSPRELRRDSLRRRVDALCSVITAGRHPRRALRTVAQSWQATRELVSGEPGPVTSLGGLVGPHRRLAFVRAPLDDVEAVARANRATVNDVLLAMICAGVRALLTSRGEQVEHLTLPIFVPVSLRRGAGDAGLGNRISQMAVDLPVGIADPVERLRRITVETSRAKAFAHPSMGAVFRNRILSGVMLRLIIRKRVNLLSADIVGPRQPLSFAGVPVLEVFPLLNLMGNITLGVGALSYAGGFQLLAEGDADHYPDLGVFATAAEHEVRILAAAGPVREGGRKQDSAVCR